MSSVERTGDAQSEDITLREIFERYKDRWVAIVVTERDKNSQPVKGRVVANEVDRYNLREKITKYKDICILYAGESPYHLLL